MSKKHIPLRDNVIIKRVMGEKTEGGIFIPKLSKENYSSIGEVIAVGNGRHLKNGTLVQMTVKVGDKVIFGRYSGSEIKLDGEEYVIMSECEISAVLE